MARFGPLGRSGRGGRNSTHYYREPKYLQNPPPILKYKLPDLSSNPYNLLNNQYCDESTFIQCVPESNNPTNSFDNHSSNDNDIATFFNNRKSLRKKQLKKTNLNVTYYDNQRHSDRINTTDELRPSKNLCDHPHNIGSSSKITLQTSSVPTSETKLLNKTPHPDIMPTTDTNKNSSEGPHSAVDNSMDVEMTHEEKIEGTHVITQTESTQKTHDNVPTLFSTTTDTDNDETMQIPTTPKGRRSKKTKATSPPVTTPSKRGKAVSTLNSENVTPTKTTLIPPDTPSQDPSDDELEKMTKDSLINEVFKLAKKTGHACTEEAFRSLSPSVLLARAKEYKSSLLAKTKSNTKKPGLIPIIKFDTADDIINALDSRKARSVFLSCLRKQEKKIERPKLDGMSLQDFKKEITQYRDSLIAKDMDFTIDDPTLTNSPTPQTTNSQDVIHDRHNYSGTDAVPSSIVSHQNHNTYTTKTNHAHFVKEPAKPTSQQIIKPVPPPRTPKVHSTNVNKYTSEKRGQSDSVFPQPFSENNTAGFNQTLISIRAKFYREFAKLSLSELARICITLVREVDGSMTVLPLTENVDEEIDNENLFPSDDDGANKYLAEVHSDRWCTKFMIRFKISTSIKSVSNNIVSYMAEHKNYATVDKLTAHKVSCIGFMNTLHPYRHNRAKLTEICETHIKNETGREVRLNVLPRALSAGKGAGLVESHFIAIEVASEDAQVVSTSLMARDFREYPNCKFVPMTKYDDKYEDLLQCIIKSHHQLCLDTNFVTVNDLDIRIPVRIETEEYASIKEILMSTNEVENPLIYDIDIAPNGATNIIYNVQADDKLEHYLQNLQHLLSQHIHPDDVSSVYKNEVPVRKILDKRRVTQFEKNHIANLQAMYNINPQDPPDARPQSAPHAPKKNLNHAGRPSTPFQTTSYLQATTRGVPSISTTTQKLESVRLGNVEKSVASMQDKFMTMDEVKKLIENSQKEAINTNPTITPTVVQKMIDNTLNGQPLHALLDPNFEPELNSKIAEAVKRIEIPEPISSETIQQMIDTSITTSNETMTTKINQLHSDFTSLDKNINEKVNEITTSFQSSVEAFTKQSEAIIAALNLQITKTPAIRIKKEDPGAKIE